MTELILGVVTATQALLFQSVTCAAQRASKPLNVAIFANGFEPDVPALRAAAPLDEILVHAVQENVGVTKGLHQIWQTVKQTGRFDIIDYQHDDVDVFENGWDARVVRRFDESPRCGLATFGGARGLGADELYRTGYEMSQLARREFLSNMRSAHLHGARATTDQRIATPDGFSMIARMAFLDQLGGWDWYPYPHHNYDNAVACHARRRGWEVWLVPVECEHYGGRTSIQPAYQEWAKQFGGDLRFHRESHTWLYNEFRDVLPLRV